MCVLTLNLDMKNVCANLKFDCLRGRECDELNLESTRRARGVSKVRKNIRNALPSAGEKSFNSFHQSIGVVMDKFFELIAEETEFETRSEDQVHQLPTARKVLLELS